MAFLILYVDGLKPFDPDAVDNAMIGSGGIRTTASYGDAIATYLYEHASDRTVVLLKNDLETIKIDGTGEASLDIAIKIQKDIAEPLHLIDEAYTFDLVLADFRSISELAKTIHESGG